MTREEAYIGGQKLQTYIRWGAPATVMADNAFKGKFAEMCAKYGVDLEEMILHQHNSNRLAEWNNQTLHLSFWSYINDEQDD